MNLNRFQIQVATGRFTLPVVILVCLLLWGVTFQTWSDWGSLIISAIIGYLMIEINTAFTLIRTRTALPVCIYWFMASALIFLHAFRWEDLVPLAFILSISQLFRSFESNSPATPIFHTFFFISLGSVIFPQFLYLVPLFWISMIPFRSISGKSLVASILGILTPYWFLFGYAFYSNELTLFWTPLEEAIHFYPIHYGALTLPEILSWGVITLLLVVSGGHYVSVSYLDKTRTRIFHSFLTIAGLWITICMALQPVHLHILMPIQLICTAFLSGHLFTLTRNRFSGILFIVTFVVFILLMSFNLWMQFFNS